MSDTTSTNISIVQANSVDSGQTGSIRQSSLSKPSTTKRLFFYKSGDPRFHGIKMVVTNRSVKTFDALLDSLSKKVPLPFGVRNITTPRGIHHVTTLEELEDGKSYICSHQKKIKPINVEKASKKPLLWQSSRPISARRRIVQLAQHNEVVPFQRQYTKVTGNSKKLVILKNGDTEFKYNVTVKKKSIQNFDTFLEEISETLQCPVFKLYSTDGRRILSIHALLLSSGTIVAAGREPFKHVNYETEREFLPATLPGISKRVIPKQRSKPEMKSQGNTESIHTSPNGKKNSFSSDKMGNRDIIDFSYIPTNEISITEHWPCSGEKLPVISPEDNIEKSVHLNCDGTMTVEMRVRFKIKEEETINWSTTVSRSDLLYSKVQLPISTLEPDVREFCTKYSSLISDTNTVKSPEEYITEIQTASFSETHQPGMSGPSINPAVYKTNSCKKAGGYFYRPPTPGIRRSQEGKSSGKQLLAGNMNKNIRQMFFSKDTGDEDISSVDGKVNNCEEQMLTAQVTYTQSTEKIEKDRMKRKGFSNAVRKEKDNILETSSMAILQHNKRTEIVSNSEYTNDGGGYVSFRRAFKNERPYSAGNPLFHQDHFKFKELKRSVSASVTYMKPPGSQDEASSGLTDFKYQKPESVNVLSNETQMENSDCLNFSKEGYASESYSSANSEGQTNSLMGNGVNSCNDDQLPASTIHKKKRKKKNTDNEINSVLEETESYTFMEGRNVENETTAYHLNNDAKAISKNKPTIKLANIISCEPDHHEVSNVLLNDASMPTVSTCAQQPELGSVKKVKGNKQMAKVKPRWIKKIEHLSAQNGNNDTTRNENKDENNITGPRNENRAANIIANETLYYTKEQSTNLTLEHNQLCEKVPKKTTKTAKKFHDTSKKQNKPKKKGKNKVIEKKIANVSDALSTQDPSSPIPCSSFETYVQSWLKNIFPNATFPVIQLFPPTRKEDILSYNSCQDDQKATKLMDENDFYSNSRNNHLYKPGEPNEMEPFPVCRETGADKDMMMLHTGPLDEEKISALIETGKQLAEIFICQCNQNAPVEGSESDNLLKWISSNQIVKISPKRESSDVAVQVEVGTTDKYSLDHNMNDDKAEVFTQQPSCSSQKAKFRSLEKSLSLPELSYKPNSSSSQVLLAWLIVLHLKQGMKSVVDDMSKCSGAGLEIFTLLQVLKKIAITEKADDLKAAVLNLQESAMSFESNIHNLTPAQMCSNATEVQGYEATHITDDQNCSIDDMWRVMKQCKVINSFQTEQDKNDVEDDLDNLALFQSLPETKHTIGNGGKNISPTNTEFEEKCLELEKQTNNSSTEMLGNIDQYLLENATAGYNEDLDDMSIKSSQRDAVSPKAKVSMEAITASPRKISNVKRIVQEMEQRKCSSSISEYQKCANSPLSSDWSDYKQDSEESLKSSKLHGSSDLLTESGDEQIQEKTIKTGFVRRAIERLYGKAESKVTPCSPACDSIKRDAQKNSKAEMSQVPHLSNEKTLRPLSSPNNYCKGERLGDCTDRIKTESLPLLETAHCSINELGMQTMHKGGLIKTGSERNDGILIDKGRWLMKENNLVRVSPPETTGMYGLLDTTSGDTFLDNTSDEVPYLNSVGKINQQLPLTDVSSSEIEDMARPHYGHYFNMPHGSDSEPFTDTFSLKAVERPKSSDVVIKTKAKDSDSSSSKHNLKRGSLPSFTTVDLHFSDNKVHPMSQPESEKANEDRLHKSSTASRGQVKEQDSLDKLHYICGQHCPILNAIIIPVNEESRRCAYRSSYDFENLVGSHSMFKPKGYNPSLDVKLLIDKNNNIYTSYKYTNVISDIYYFNTNMYFHFGCKEADTDDQIVKIINKYLLKMLTCTSNTQYSTTPTNMVFKNSPGVQTDENNNVVHQHQL